MACGSSGGCCDAGGGIIAPLDGRNSCVVCVCVGASSTEILAKKQAENFEKKQ